MTLPPGVGVYHATFVLLVTTAVLPLSPPPKKISQVDNGRVMLEFDVAVCKEGDSLTSEQVCEWAGWLGEEGGVGM